ncbi:MAG: protein kinase domain-containing protein, partial [Vicinamibacteria bacterium]
YWMTIETGTRLAHYQITGKLGAGGMGEVYRARDTKLDREVAIKVLPEKLSQDPERLSRFEREAKAVAALSHPNILAIHDFGKAGGVSFAVTELLEGPTLREILDGGGVPQRKAIEYAGQIAKGLAAAHDRGIVHRDLKPNNVIVTRDGRVKILDFGLAKLMNMGMSEAPTRAPSSEPGTGAGVILGTVGYMSPEQVRGEPADHRSDIFSFGAMLYELVTGERAFARETAAETMTAILKEDPPKLSGSGGLFMPPGLERVTRHCVEKSPDERFQSAHDLAFALDAITQTSVVSGAFDLSALPGRSRRQVSIPVAGLTAAATLLVGLLAGWVIFRSAPVEPLQYQRLTFQRGHVLSARFSADEQTVIYGASWEGAPPEIFTTQIGTPGSRPLGFGWADLLSISPTGEMAVSLNRHFTVGFETTGTLARVPLEGGAPREVLESVHDADWGPDGESLAVVRTVEGRNRLEYPIGNVLYETDGWMSSVRVSPDGNLIAFNDHPVRGDNVGPIAVIDLEGNKTILPGGGAPQGLVWSPDGKEIWGAQGATLFAQSLDGERRNLSSSVGSLALLDVAADGRMLLTSQTWRREMVGKQHGAVEEVNLSWFDWSAPKDLSADGRLVLFEEQNRATPAGYPLYLRGLDGSPPLRLGDGMGLAISPDNRWALALSDPFGKPKLILHPTGPGQARELELGDDFEPHPWASWLPDGSGVLLGGSLSGGGPRFFFNDLQGGALEPVTPEGTRFINYSHAISPDGAWVATVSPEDKLYRYPIGGGEGVPIPGGEVGDFPLQWDADGNHIYVYRRGGIPTQVLKLNLSTGEREIWKELEPADSAGVFTVSLIYMTRDGERYIYSYRRTLSDLYLASKF